MQLRFVMRGASWSLDCRWGPFVLFVLLFEQLIEYVCIQLLVTTAFLRLPYSDFDRYISVHYSRRLWNWLLCDTLLVVRFWHGDEGIACISYSLLHLSLTSRLKVVKWLPSRTPVKCRFALQAWTENLFLSRGFSFQAFQVVVVLVLISSTQS